MRLVDPDALDLREDGSFPHPHLAVILGFGCKLCCFRSRSSDILYRHLVKEHGSNRKTKNDWYSSDYMEEGLKLQSWTQVGKRGLWKVCQSDHITGR